jgi:hypothetical protein
MALRCFSTHMYMPAAAGHSWVKARIGAVATNDQPRGH